MNRFYPFPVVLFASFFLFFGCKGRPEPVSLIVYGSSSSGIMAAVQAARMGASVIIVTPDRHLGGLTYSGLGWTDAGQTQSIGGLAREFYGRVYRHYRNPEAWVWQDRSDFQNIGQGTAAMNDEEGVMWVFEPHVAETVFESFIREHDIPVYRDEWLDRESGVRIENGRIRFITMQSGRTFTGRMFIDATYEGDLMAAAGVSYHVGREAAGVYGETWNGVQVGVLHHSHHFSRPISPYRIPGDPSSGLVPRVSALPPGEKGSGDRRVQAFCYRMCLSNHPNNRVAFPKPDDYDPDQYELLLRVFATGWREGFKKFDAIPNRKTDTNNHGPFSTDNIGMNHDYPEADYERRREILKEHESYQKGLMYFIANYPRVPADVRGMLREWGLARDEFTDNGNWPRQIYVREARRMIGAYVMAEQDVLGTRPVPQPAGMGSYTLDSHNVQRYVTPEGFVQNEGDIGVPVAQPYRIAYGALTPKKSECENLLVPVCVSCSHIAFGSIRMEPVFMILGQSAATAAVQAIQSGCAVQDIDYGQLASRLRQDKQRL